MSEPVTGAAVAKGALVIVKAAVEANAEAFKPAATEVGKVAYTVTRSVNIALAPLRVLVWGYDHIESYLHETIERKLSERNVPQDRIKAPDPDVAVPAIEAMRYTKLKEEFANLLATAMDSASAILAHPAFVEILKQITPDEARILKLALPWIGYMPVIDLGFDAGGGQVIDCRNVSKLGILAGCANDTLTPQYIDNLCRLGITEVQDRVLVADAYRDLCEAPAYKAAAQRVQSMKSARFVENRKIISLTDLGRNFKSACLPPDSSSTFEINAIQPEKETVPRWG